MKRLLLLSPLLLAGCAAPQQTSTPAPSVSVPRPVAVPAATSLSAPPPVAPLATTPQSNAPEAAPTSGAASSSGGFPTPDYNAPEPMVTFTRKMIASIKQSSSSGEMSAVSLHLSAESSDLQQGGQKWDQQQQYTRAGVYHDEAKIYTLLSNYARMRSDYLSGVTDENAWAVAKKNADYAVDTAYSVDTRLGELKATPQNGAQEPERPSVQQILPRAMEGERIR